MDQHIKAQLESTAFYSGAVEGTIFKNLAVFQEMIKLSDCQVYCKFNKAHIIFPPLHAMQ